MADPPLTIAQQLQGRIAAIDVEIERVKARAIEDVAALRADKAVLVRAAAVLAGVPDGEALLIALRKLGV
jgi:hypothetical protein